MQQLDGQSCVIWLEFQEYRAIFNLPTSVGRSVPTALRRGVAQNDQYAGRLDALNDFGSNPGDLEGWIYVPRNVRPRASLVLVLHGCTQTAAGYDRAAGWSALAERLGFIVLLPGQKRTNNPNLCFNWFSPRDARRDRGEALSMIEMIKTVQELHGTSTDHVFITGLSAGGAMAAVMLATYPEIFAGGAIIAGLPYGTANNVPQALERMRGHDMPSSAQLEKLVRSASRFDGAWPVVSVWHGSDDTTVNPANGRAIVAQWRAIHNLPERPSKDLVVGAHKRRVWTDPKGRELVEEYVLHGLGHGTPLSTLDKGSAERTAPHMLEAGISSTRLIAHFWGLDAGQAQMETETADEQIKPAAKRPTPVHSGPPENSVGATIEAALRAAGLLR